MSVKWVEVGERSLRYNSPPSSSAVLWIVNVCERKTSQKNNSDAQIILLYQSLVWLLETNYSKTELKMFDKFV